MENFFFTKNINILDPLSCIIYLAILGFKEKGTKLSIKNSKIELQKPIITQGITRWYNCDIRNDISELCNPIEKAIEWYNELSSITKIFSYSINSCLLIQMQDMQNCSILFSELANEKIICNKFNYCKIKLGSFND